MKAKDTVLFYNKDSMISSIRLEQAEISFKAGIKEVIDFVNKRVPYAFKYFEDEIGKEKLKEWDITE